MKTYTDLGLAVIDPASGAMIPKDTRNNDWQRVQAEIAAGNAQLQAPAP